jgi:hypothetical protein
MVLRNRIFVGKPLRNEELIWYRCNNGHFTPCRTPSMRNFYCKDCNKIILKQLSEKYSDSANGKYRAHAKRYRLHKQKRVVRRITQENGDVLLLTLYTPSSRTNYKKAKQRGEES